MSDHWWDYIEQQERRRHRRGKEQENEEMWYGRPAEGQGEGTDPQTKPVREGPGRGAGSIPARTAMRRGGGAICDGRRGGFSVAFFGPGGRRVQRGAADKRGRAPVRRAQGASA